MTNVMALDLELNQPSGKIIQVGITIGNIYTGAILEKRGWIIYVPESLDPINPYITKLTTITQEMVNDGVLLITAYREMVELYKKHNCTLNFVTWGGGDHKALKAQLYEHCEEVGMYPTGNSPSPEEETPAWEFGHREFDTKTVFLAYALSHRLKVRSGLAKSMTRVGLAFKGTKHWAPDDAENTFTLLKHLIDRLPSTGILKK